tara:strand:- start:68 stop:481 length:414 start_codon:yes stop_codon:yes gene_type:complete
MFFKKDENFDKNRNLVKIAALLIHAAKIDQNYSDLEKEIIKKTLINLNIKKENIDKIIKQGEEIEENSNQILDFTKEVKNMKEENKIEILENLWRIIYSNKEADIYETNLMRRLGGLLYIDKKIMADIKDKIKKEYL